MQKLSFHGQPTLRIPMLDLTNLHLSTIDHSKPSKVASGTKLAFQPMTARAYSTLDSFQVPKCKHAVKLNSINNQYWNCADCGAFISYEGISGIQEESRRSHLEMTPSILMEKMIGKQHINRTHKETLEKSEILSRKKLFDWLCETGESFRLTPESIHKAAHFLDVIMAENTIAPVDLQPLGLVCLLLSAKLTEKDSQVEQIKRSFEKINKIQNQLQLNEDGSFEQEKQFEISSRPKSHYTSRRKFLEEAPRKAHAETGNFLSFPSIMLTKKLLPPSQGFP